MRRRRLPPPVGGTQDLTVAASQARREGALARIRHSQEQIEEMLGKRVFLELFVKVRENWRGSREFVDELDWRRQMERLADGGKA